MHGEAGSVDLAAVEAEKLRIRELLMPFAPKDRWNADETAFFPFVPPDRGLAKEQMSRKKSSKFRLTLLLACNADGSEKKSVFHIGKFKQPQCFGKIGPNECRFEYRSNKAAWMTQQLFEEYVRSVYLLATNWRWFL